MVVTWAMALTMQFHMEISSMGRYIEAESQHSYVSIAKALVIA